jgi:hypothetical protein
MYKCIDCGNSEKFIGTAYEKGEVIIEKNCLNESKQNPYSWIYIISDKKWESDCKVLKCFYCNSGNIKNL